METFLPIPPDGDVNKGPRLIILDSIELSLSVTAVALRLITRKFLSKFVGWDDWTIVIACVC